MNEHIPKDEPTASPDRPLAEATPDAAAPVPAPEPAGLIGVVLPGPGAPALVAGGLMLWPGAFGKVERWMQRRFPVAHRKGIGHINRFLSDLERRYPGSTGTTGEPPRSGPA
jgi:hypothetical protein